MWMVQMHRKTRCGHTISELALRCRDAAWGLQSLNSIHVISRLLFSQTDASIRNAWAKCNVVDFARSEEGTFTRKGEGLGLQLGTQAQQTGGNGRTPTQLMSRLSLTCCTTFRLRKVFMRNDIIRCYNAAMVNTYHMHVSCPNLS